MQIGTIIQFLILFIGTLMIVSPIGITVRGDGDKRHAFESLNDSMLLSFTIILIGATFFYWLPKFIATEVPPSFAIAGFIIVFALLVANRAQRFMRRKKATE